MEVGEEERENRKNPKFVLFFFLMCGVGDKKNIMK